MRPKALLVELRQGQHRPAALVHGDAHHRPVAGEARRLQGGHEDEPVPADRAQPGDGVEEADELRPDEVETDGRGGEEHQGLDRDAEAARRRRRRGRRVDDDDARQPETVVRRGYHRRLPIVVTSNRSVLVGGGRQRDPAEPRPPCRAAGLALAGGRTSAPASPPSGRDPPPPVPAEPGGAALRTRAVVPLLVEPVGARRATSRGVLVVHGRQHTPGRPVRDRNASDFGRAAASERGRLLGEARHRRRRSAGLGVSGRGDRGRRAGRRRRRAPKRRGGRGCPSAAPPASLDDPAPSAAPGRHGLAVGPQAQDPAAVELVPHLGDGGVHGGEADEDALPAGDLGDRLRCRSSCRWRAARRAR